MATSRIEVDLAAIGRNYGLLRSMLDGARAAASAESGSGEGSGEPGAARPGGRVAFCGVIKQDGYGMGAARLAKKLSSLGAEILAVYCIDEARALADVPIQTPLMVLMPIRAIDRADPAYRLAVRERLHFAVHDIDQVAELAQAATRLGLKLPVHVQLDTGMSRGGALEEDATKMVEMVLASSRLRLAGLMTHFSSPSTDDAYTREQARAFRAWMDSIKPMLSTTSGLMIHASNTAAALRSRSLHANTVRVGQGMFGYGMESFTDPLGVEFASVGKQLEPAVRWLSRIVHIHEVPKGWPVGYNRTFKTQRPTRVALIPVGYADGYSLALSNNAKVGLTGQAWDRPRTVGREGAPAPERSAYAPVVGRVSMDQITIDVTGLPETLARVGAEVELIGRDPQGPNHLPNLAKAAGTITHEMLCRVCPHIERVYLSQPGVPEEGSSGAAVVGRLAATAIAV